MAGVPLAKRCNNIKAMVKKHVVLEGQSLLDVCVQYYGSAQHVFVLCDANDLLPDDLPAAGTTLIIPNMPQMNTEIVSQIIKQGITPATLPVNNFDASLDLPEGIDYWTIGIDFIIQ